MARLGGVFVPLNPQVKPGRLRGVLRDAEPAVIVSSRPIEEQILDQVATVRHVITTEAATRQRGKLSLADLTSRSASSQEDRPLPDDVAVSPDDLLALLYTSGTTGEPKAAMHSHRSLIAPVAATHKLRELWKKPSFKMLGKQIKAFARYRERLLRAAGKPQTLLSTTGWHTITGMEVMFQGVLTGDRLVVMPHFHPRRAPELGERERATVLIAVPMAYRVMLRLDGFDEYDTSSLIVCGTGAQSCPPQLAEEIEDRFGCAVHIGFGATETGGGIAVTSLADSDERRTGSVGRPLLETAIKVVDERGRQLPPGQVGELVCRSDGLMVGYYQAPEMTAQVMDEDGWYHTGDLASVSGSSATRT